MTLLSQVKRKKRVIVGLLMSEITECAGWMMAIEIDKINDDVEAFKPRLEGSKEKSAAP
jgi:hypothetical protein